MGKKISRYGICTARPKVCPLCLAKRSFVSMLWDLTLVTCCPAHGFHLIDTCPKCGKKLSWYQETLSGCPAPGCGFDFTRAAPESVPDAELHLPARSSWAKKPAGQTGGRDTVGKILNLGAHLTGRLAAAGLLKPARGPAADGTRLPYFDPGAVSALLEAFYHGFFQKARHCLNTQRVCLKRLLSELRWHKLAFADLVSKVVQGTIVPCAPGPGAGLSCFFFDRARAVARLVPCQAPPAGRGKPGV